MKRAFLSALDVELKEFDPGLQRGASDCYVKSSPVGPLSLVVASFGKSYGLEFYAPSANIRLDDVEEFVARFEERLPGESEAEWASGVAERSTIGIRITRNPSWWLWEGTWVVRDEQDVPKIARKYARHVYPRAARFWDEYQSRERILSGLMKFNTAVHGKSAIALATLLNGDTRGREVAETLCSRAKPNIAAEIRAWAELALAQNEIKK